MRTATDRRAATIEAVERFYRPKTAQQQTAHEKFQRLNRFVTEHGGWITSPPGEKVIRIETLPGSTLPGDLAELGYRLLPTGEGERILPTAIVHRFSMRPDGTAELLTEGSTKVVCRTVTHAGIIVVQRFDVMAL